MSLQLETLSIGNTAVARRSTRREPWQAVFVREIGDEDMILLHSISKAPPDPKAPLAKIRDHHHYMARLIAEGTEDIEVSRITGYTVNRIRTLQRDPSFAELVEFYTEERVHRDLDIDMSIRHVAMAATSVLMERLDEEPEAFSNEELRKLRDASLDRIGKGPTSKRINEISDPKGVLEEIRNMMLTESSARIIPRDEITADYTEVLEDVEENTSLEETPGG